jgi:prophage regulatory protein
MRNILTKKQVMKICGLSYTTIWREENAGRFPSRVSLTLRRVGWFEDEIEAWLESRVRLKESIEDEIDNSSN